jgi:hypothetical protein
VSANRALESKTDRSPYLAYEMAMVGWFAASNRMPDGPTEKKYVPGCTVTVTPTVQVSQTPWPSSEKTLNGVNVMSAKTVLEGSVYRTCTCVVRLFWT